MTSQWMQCVMYAYQAVPMQHNKQFSGGRGLNDLLWYTIDIDWREAAVYGDFGRVPYSMAPLTYFEMCVP